MFPLEWKLIAGGIGALALLGLLGVAAAAIERHGEDKATQILQPKLDKANHDLGVLSTANAQDEATITRMLADQQANDILIAQYADRVTALNQQADDTAAAIRRLQANDQTVDAYLRTPVPDALRGVYLQPAAGNDPGAGDAHGAAAAAR